MKKTRKEEKNYMVKPWWIESFGEVWCLHMSNLQQHSQS